MNIFFRNTQMKEYWRKHKKADWNYHITQKAILFVKKNCQDDFIKTPEARKGWKVV